MTRVIKIKGMAIKGGKIVPKPSYRDASHVKRAAGSKAQRVVSKAKAGRP